MGVWDMFLFYLVFPLSRPACRALHGWAWRLRQRSGVAAFLLALPICAAIAALQLASTLMGLLAVIMFGSFGSIFTPVRRSFSLLFHMLRTR